MTAPEPVDVSHAHSRLLALVGCIHGLVLEFDREARYLNAWADDPALLARPPADMIGKTINEVLGAEAGAPFTAAVERVYDTGKMESFEYPLDLDNGRHWFFADIKRVGAADAGMSVVFFARDISGRKATEEALARSEERYRLAARATNDALWDCDLATGAITWGASANETLGWTELGADVAWIGDAIHPDDRERVRAGLARALAGGASSWSDRYRFRRGDGRYADILDRGFIVRDAGGAPSRMVGSMADLTELHRLQAQVIQADRLAALGMLAAGVGHEINNPLTYVLNNVDHAISELEAKCANQSALKEIGAALKDAYDGATRIAEIVKSLKMFSRAEGVETGPVDVHAVLERAIKMAENEIRHRARLARSFAPLPPVCGTESQLAQVFLNLLINAAQSIADGNRDANEVRVAAGVDARGRPFVSVSDTGKGIAPEHLGRIFDPFFTTNPFGTGTGLGLSICHDIVRKLGGEMTVESAPGQGTTFTVHLAAVEGAPATRAARADAKPARPRMLVIDDDAPIGVTLQRMLRGDVEVVPFTSGRKALDSVARGDVFDVVLCDIMMPDLTGMDFFDALKTTRPELLPRVVFMTGGAFTERAREFLDAENAPPCIEKPLEKAAVREIVRRIASAARGAGPRAG